MACTTEVPESLWDLERDPDLYLAGLYLVFLFIYFLLVYLPM